MVPYSSYSIDLVNFYSGFRFAEKIAKLVGRIPRYPVPTVPLLTTYISMG